MQSFGTTENLYRADKILYVFILSHILEIKTDLLLVDIYVMFFSLKSVMLTVFFILAHGGAV